MRRVSAFLFIMKLKKAYSIQTRKSSQKIWKKVFDEISSPTETFGYNSEQRVVQELLMQEIWKEEE